MGVAIENSETYPGVELAYDFIVPSYAWLLTRLEAADNRIQTLQLVASTFTAAIPTIAKALNQSVSFDRWQFVVAMFVFCLLVLVGVVARVRGGIYLANPQVLWQKYLRFTPWEYKKNALYWAAEHFQKNQNLIATKAKAAVWMTAFFGIEMLLLAGWAVTSTILP